jgi:activating signal cointegrator complex subunit 3
MSAAMQEPPRLAGALRAQLGGGSALDLPHLMAVRPQAAAKASTRARSSRASAECFSWSRFAGAAHGSRDGATAAARHCHHKFLQLVADMLGGEASSEQLHGAAQAVYDVLTAPGKSPADRRADIVNAIGFVEQEALKAVTAMVADLQQWRESNSAPAEARAADTSEHREVEDAQVSTSRRVNQIRRDRAIDWERDLNNLPFFDSGDEEDAEEDTPAGGGAGCGDGGDPVEFLEARLVHHCASLGLPAEAVVDDVFGALSSSRGMDEVQSMLCDVVGFEGLDLISDLLAARTPIAIHVSQQRVAREQAEASSRSMASPAAFGGFSITTAKNQELMKQMKKEERRRRKGDAEREADQDGWLKLQGFNPAHLRAQREAELAAGPQSSNRGATTFDGSVAGFAGVNKLVLPPGTRRILHDKDNFEEILVPPQTKAPIRGSERRIPTTEFSAFCQAAFEGIPFLNRVQSIVYPVAYKTGNNMLVCAPTGAGKTECAMMTVLHCLEQHLDRGILKSDEFKIVYVAPMKALASEVTDKFAKRLGRLGLVVKELTGDMQLTRREISDTHMLVVTPEKWDVMTRKSSDAALTALVKLLIIDEIHLLNEDRGAVLEAIVARTLRQVERSQSMIRIVGLSATLPTYKDVAIFLRVNVDKDLFYFDNAYRPVPLETGFIGVMGSNPNKQRATMLEVTFRKVLERVRAGHQVMVFVHSRKDTYKTARTLIEMAQQEGSTGEFEPSEHAKYGHWSKFVAKSRNKEIRELFAGGFSCHHAGILRSDRNMVEKLFAEGLVKVLVCTATLAWGVNLPAHSVIIKGTQVYDAKKGSFVELGVLDVMQVCKIARARACECVCTFARVLCA